MCVPVFQRPSGCVCVSRCECVLTAMTLTKSFSPSVSRMVLMVCLAMVIFRPFMLPLMSTMMMMSLGDVAAWMYLQPGGRRGAGHRIDHSGQ